MAKHRHKLPLGNGEAHAAQDDIQFIVFLRVAKNYLLCRYDVSHLDVSLFMVRFAAAIPAV